MRNILSVASIMDQSDFVTAVSENTEEQVRKYIQNQKIK